MNKIREATFAQYEGIPDYVVAADDRGILDASQVMLAERLNMADQFTPYSEFASPRHMSERRSSLVSSTLARIGIFETNARHAKPRTAKPATEITLLPEPIAEPVLVVN